MTTTKNNIPVGYKDSAVGIIPQEWKVKQLALLGKIFSGGTPSTDKEEYWGGNIMWCTPSDITSLSSKYINNTKDRITAMGLKSSSAILLPINSIIVCTRATIGTAAITQVELSTNQGFKNIKPEKCNTEWLYYSMILNQPKLQRLGCGSTFLEVSKRDFERLKLAVPPMEEQRKIVEILGVWDEAIEKQNLLIEKLELRKRALMQRLLTSKTRLPSFTTPVDYKQLKPFIVEVSERNAKQTITEVLSVTNSRGFVSQIEQFYREVASANTTNYKVIRKGQFAYNPSRVNVGSLDLLRTFEVGILSPMYVVFKTLPTISTQYLYYLLKSNWFIGHIPMYVQGSVRDSLSFDGLRDMKFWIPSLPEQKAIAEVLTTADNEIAIHRKTLDALRKQKRGLMQQLLTGKTRVKI